jgi:predicted amidohydrolase
LKSLTLALAQFSPKLCDKEHNLKKMEELIVQAWKNNAQLIIFPEMALTGYVCRDLFYQLAEPLNGPSITRLGKSAAQNSMYLIFGMPEEGEVKGVIYNSAVLISPKGAVKAYRKIYLPTHAVFDEKRYFRPGKDLHVFDTGIGKVGLTICYDLCFPELFRLLTLDGAQLIACISASPSVRKDYFEVFTRARAMENGVFLAYVNLVGVEDGLQFWGGSRLISPEGKILAAAKYDEESLVFSEVDYGDLLHARAFLPTLRDLRLDTYETLLKKAL